jgi:pyruvate-ferredoxin/flavodoxin oxidoreductase
VVLNVKGGAATAWDVLPLEAQEQVIAKHLELWAIDAFAVAKEAGIDGHVGVIMEACFFARAGALPLDEALTHVRASIAKTYGKKGEAVVAANLKAIDLTLARLERVAVPAAATTTRRRPPVVSAHTPDRVARVLGMLMSGHGDLLPVSAFPVDGTWPTGTSQYEKRDIALETPVWDAPLCIQCNKCALVCPHAAIRAKVFSPALASTLPAGFETLTYKSPDFAGSRYTLQVSPDDCTGCGLCVAVCPAHDKANPDHFALAMAPKEEHHDRQRRDFEAFLALPEADRGKVRLDVKGSQLLQPLFEFSGACAGCGETPYLKLLTQLFGDRLLIANATGCSSIFGGNLPSTPYAKNDEGRGPAWSNSLFEDNAEFGLGFRLAADVRRDQARALVTTQAGSLGDLATALLDADQSTEAGIIAQRGRVVALKQALAGRTDPSSRALFELGDDLVKKSVWLVGGDGWAYDIGFGGLDHVLAQHHDVNVLVLDTEVYSNTGGQQSKATPRAATARFASHGKDTGEKDLAVQAMTYGHVYVARVAFGAKDAHTVKVLQEAESYPGPSLVLAYAHCVAHGYDLEAGLEHQKLAVATGAWPLFRFDPRRVEKGEAPMVLDSAPPSVSLEELMASEGRFRSLKTIDASRYARLHSEARREAAQRYAVYEQLSRVMVSGKAIGG